MDGRIPWRRAAAALLVAFVLVRGSAPRDAGQAADAEGLYWEADFSAVLERLDQRGPGGLRLEEELLAAECLARTGRGEAAEKRLAGLRSSAPPELPPSLKGRMSATEGVVLFSLGRVDEARSRVRAALVEDPASDRALLAMVYLGLLDRAPAEAVRQYEALQRAHPRRAGSYLLYLVGLEVHMAARDPRKMAEAYRLRAVAAGREKKAYAQGLRTNARLSEKNLKDGYFSVQGPSPERTIPFATDGQARRPNVILLETHRGRFRVLLDTGNRAGWTVHNPELLEILRSRRGGRVLSEIGTQPGFLEGYSISTPALRLSGLTISGLSGLYVPKPHPEFYDANLNPAFIGNRVVTLDYVRQRLVVRTKEKFEKDLSAAPQGRMERLPWLDYGHVFVRAEADGSPALAILETGAEDISLRLDFARRLGLPLVERHRYMATGGTAAYHLAPVRLRLGPFLFERRQVEAWPLDRLAHPVTGLIPDAVVGPAALAGSYVLSFDPFENRIVLEKPAGPAGPSLAPAGGRG